MIVRATIVVQAECIREDPLGLTWDTTRFCIEAEIETLTS